MAIFSQGGEIEAGLQTRLSVPRVGEDLPMRINDERTTGIGIVGIRPGAIHGEDEGLIFHRARLEQSHPMRRALFGPVRDDDEELGAMLRGRRAEELWETEVITDKRSDRAAAPGKHDWLISGGVVLPLLAGGEQPHLGVGGKQLAVGAEHQDFIARSAIDATDGGSRDETQLEFAGKARDDVPCGAAGRLGHAGGVHTETSGKHLREGDEGSRSWAMRGQQLPDLRKICGLVFPGQIELKRGDIHSQKVTDRREKSQRRVGEPICFAKWAGGCFGETTLPGCCGGSPFVVATLDSLLRVVECANCIGHWP